MNQNILFNIITNTDFDKKILLAKSLSKKNPIQIDALDKDSLKKLRMPGRPTHFKIVPPKKVPKRNFQDSNNRLNFLHAIANIELLAIELPALCLLRFGSQDLGFIQTQLQIIQEEAHHFELLKDRLQGFNCPFGSLPVHHGLWDYAWRCASELEHQILIPCYLEARGLDVSPTFIKNFIEIGDQKTATIMQLILDEEIIHVKHGNHYLKKKSQELNSTPDDLFEKILTHFFGNKLKSKVAINEYYRKQAGFSDKQIQLIK